MQALVGNHSMGVLSSSFESSGGVAGSQGDESVNGSWEGLAKYAPGPGLKLRVPMAPRRAPRAVSKKCSFGSKGI